MKVMLLIVQSE